MGEEIGGIRKSQFNEDVSKMGRIAKLQFDINERMSERQYRAVFELIGRLFAEVYSKCTQKEKDDFITDLFEVDTILRRYSNNSYLLNAPKSNRYVYNKLFYLDLKLRTLLDRHGYSGRDEKDPSKAVIN